MSRSRKVVADHELFAAVMRDAKPLARKSKIPRPLVPRPAQVEALSGAGGPNASAKTARLQAAVAAAPVNPGIANPGIDRRTAERLRRGEMAIDRRLDLHGMTEAAAHAALDRAVAAAWCDGLRVLLVITGKGSLKEGGGVLRRNLPRWPAIGDHARHVLRLETAQPKHGGGGAYYVLLRRRRS